MRGARLWVKVPICNLIVPAYVCKAGHEYLEEAEGETRYAAYNGELPRIAISLEQPDDAVRECLLHEVCHGYIQQSGIDHTLFKGNQKLQEDFIRTFSPHFYTGMRAAGMLKFPRIPRF